MAGRSAKCKKCGERMRVPEPEPKVVEDDDFIPLVEDEEEKPSAVSRDSRPVAVAGDFESTASGEATLDDEPLAPYEEFSMSDLQSLAAPEDDAELEPSVFKSQVAFAAPQAAPSNKAAAIGGGLMKNLTAMWEALVNPSQADGHIPQTRRISVGGSFLLINSVLLMFFALVQASPAKLQQVRGVLNNKVEFGWMQGTSNTGPMLLTAAVGFIFGLVVMGWRYWSPRKEDESKLVLIVFWIILALVFGSSFIAMVGGLELTLILSQAGSFGVLLAAAAFGAWVFLRLASDGDGSMSLLLLAPAVIMPLTILIVIVTNVPSEAIDQLPWGKIILFLFLMFLALMLMGGAIAFMILIALPFQLIGIIQRPPSPIDLPTGASAGGIGLLMIGGFCFLCYLFLVIARWRVMLKPVAWQFVILLFGASLMLGVKDFAYTAQVGRVDRQIAEENERLTQILREAGRIGPAVTASHEPFPNSSKLLGPDRIEVVYLSNGDRISQEGGITEDWVDPDSTKLPSYRPEPITGTRGGDASRPGVPPELASFDPTLGRTDPGPVRYIQPGVDDPPGMSGRNPSDVNPEGARQPGKLASWTPFPHSGRARGIGVRFLYFAKGGISANPSDETLMMYGMKPDTRPKPLLPMVPQFNSKYLPVGAKPLAAAIRSSDNRDGAPVGRDAWPTFIQPPTVNLDGVLPFAFDGYELDILAGYEVKAMRRDPKTGIRTLVIALENQADLEHPPLEVYLAPQDRMYNGIPEKDDWDDKLDVFDPVILSRVYEFGLIDGHEFARIPPDAWHLQAQDTRYYYVSQMLDAPYWVGMSISSAMQSPAGILECEAMARSLRRLPASTAIPILKNLPPSTTAKSDAQGIAGTAWHVNGVFAFPKEISKTFRAEVDHENDDFLSLSWTKEGSGIFIEMYPKESSDEAGIRVQKEGPELIHARPDRGKEGFTGKTVGAFGRDVRYEKLWNDEPFVRVDHGPILFVQGKLYSEVAYYGWLGEYWVKARLRGREDSDITLGQLEAMLRQMRLAHPIEVGKGRDFEKWAGHFVSSSTVRQKMPLAGGVTLGDAFDRDRNKQIVPDEKIDPYGGLEPAVFAGTTLPPKDEPDVVVKPPAEPEPELPPGLEPVEGFERWTVVDAAEQYLGSTQSFGGFRFKPLKDLRASAKNNDRYAEWFARTDSGKLGLTLKFEKLPPGQEPIKVPMTIDPASGKVTLQLGRRTLTPDEAPDVTYHDTDEIRIWRILMPQAGGSPLRRCYYVAAVTDGHLIIAADFERDKTVQLQAMDASVASLIDARPDPVE